MSFRGNLFSVIVAIFIIKRARSIDRADTCADRISTTHYRGTYLSRRGLHILRLWRSASRETDRPVIGEPCMTKISRTVAEHMRQHSDGQAEKNGVQAGEKDDNEETDYEYIEGQEEIE